VLFALVKGFLTRQQRLTRKLANPLDMIWGDTARRASVSEGKTSSGKRKFSLAILRASSTVS